MVEDSKDTMVDLPEMVKITKEKHRSLVEDFIFLNCLISCGVDNWSGYEEAQAMYGEDLQEILGGD